MKKIALALIAAASAAGALSTAHAADIDLKPYMGVGVVASEHKYNLPGDTSNADRTSNEYGGKLYGGVMFDKNFGLEIGYTDFGKSNYNYSFAGANGHVDSDSKSYYIAGKAQYPINEQFNVFGKLGVAHNKNDISTSGLANVYGYGDNSRTSVYAGIGAEYALTQKVSAVVEYEYYGKNDIDQGRRKGAISLGAKYAF
jgi:OOP family OmpA-OmpF porin